VEARAQVVSSAGRLPDEIVACVGGGSNAIGIFHPFIDDSSVVLTGVEAGGQGISSQRHAARFATGKVGVLHGTKTWLLQNAEGQILETHSISAGLDYAAVGPEHAMLQGLGRSGYTFVTDDEALMAFRKLSEIEGIIPALESAHAIAYAMKIAKPLGKEKILLVNLSGRGDKDIEQVRKLSSPPSGGTNAGK
jgi:tryptophan synthase beta chain